MKSRKRVQKALTLPVIAPAFFRRLRSTLGLVSFARFGSPTRYWNVASCPPRAKSSSGVGARSLYDPVSASAQSLAKSQMPPTAALNGVKA
jgi:hypothetical protein